MAKKNLVIIFTEELCETIAKMTNLYAERLIAKNKGNLSSRLNKWKKVTSSEMKLVFGFILHQGMIYGNLLLNIILQQIQYFLPLESKALCHIIDFE